MSEATFFFGGWEPIVRILVVGTLLYAGLLVLVRPTGVRTLSRMNAFDLVITIALGAAFGRALTASGVALAEALVALALLIMLQYAVSWAQSRWAGVRGLVRSPPMLLFFQGEVLRDELRRQRVTESELLEAVREETYGSLDDVDAIVLESDGEFSVIERVDEGDAFEASLKEPLRPGSAA